MKTKTVALSLGFLLAAGSLFADSPLMGDWKLDETKSKIAAGTGKNMDVDYHDVLGGRIKVEAHGVDANGQKTDVEWQGRFDGKDYPVHGDSTADTRAYTKVDDRTLTMVTKKAGKVVGKGRIEVSPDGKTRTVTVTGTTATGKKYKTIAVYNRD